MAGRNEHDSVVVADGPSGPARRNGKKKNNGKTENDSPTETDSVNLTQFMNSTEVESVRVPDEVRSVRCGHKFRKLNGVRNINTIVCDCAASLSETRVSSFYRCEEDGAMIVHLKHNNHEINFGIEFVPELIGKFAKFFSYSKLDKKDIIDTLETSMIYYK